MEIQSPLGNNLAFVEEDDSRYLLKDPEGNTIPVAKAMIPEGSSAYAKIQKLKESATPKRDFLTLSPGEEAFQRAEIVAPEMRSAPVVDVPVFRQPAAAPSAGVSGTFKTPEDVAVTQASPVPVQQAASPIQLPDAQGMMQSAFGKMQRAANLQADAQIEAADAQAKANEAFLGEYEKKAAEYERQRKELIDEGKKIQDDIIGQKVDPGRFWATRTSAQKADLWIGAILTGLGGGNATEQLDKFVERDIEAQKMEFGKKQTLLENNLKRLGNLDAAETATRLQMNAILQAKVQLGVSRAGTKLAQAEAMKALGDLQLKQAEQAQKLAQIQSSRLLAQAAFKGIPEQIEPQIFASMTDEQRKAWGERRVTVGGQVMQANDPKDAEVVRKEMSLIDPALSEIQKIKRIVEKSATGMPISPEDRAKVSTTLKLLRGQVAQISLGGVASDTEGEIIEEALGNPNNPFSIERIQKLQTAIDVINRKKDSILRSRVMGYNPIPERPGIK